MPRMRGIIHIDEELCNGCGQCILDCTEGALQLVDGKARLVGEIYCDGLGACLSGCPTGALTIEKREAEAFDEEAVEELLASQDQPAHPEPVAPTVAQPIMGGGGCQGHAAMSLEPTAPVASDDDWPTPSQLGHWPIKLQLLSPQAPFLKGADLILLADCAAAALPDLHRRFLLGRAVALACPKLDDAQAHVDKLAELLAGGGMRSLTIVHMEVPCCSGLNWIVEQAMQRAGAKLPVGEMVISRNGTVLGQRNLPWSLAA
ncbi:ATP-binding protein [Desulfoferula mesophila]|uniref:Ferredoxin n=1 Tax=Desulfoferula mesophila TaxID=3058419 RepID=A0AAU9EA34_9BACT|nr:ferredoxin [Desulfoferula mesophilus]